MSNFASELSVGDLVIMSASRWDHASVREVERVTKTLIILKGTNVRFRRDCGWQHGGDTWSKRHLEEWSKEKETIINNTRIKAHIVHQLNGTSWGRLPLATLERIYNDVKGQEGTL